jgi:hypothetical protein
MGDDPVRKTLIALTLAAIAAILLTDKASNYLKRRRYWANVSRDRMHPYLKIGKIHK